MLSRIVLFSGLVGVIAAASFLAGCGATGTGSGGGRQIVAAFYPLAYVAEQISGGTAEVKNLTPAGAEPHDLELTTGDVRAIDGAALVLYLGGGFMPALERALQERSGPSVDLLAGTESGQGGTSALTGDPHVWLDPVLYAAMARRIGKALGREAAAERLEQRLEQLDADYRRGLRHCARRQIVTSHAAFGYLATRYGLEQIPLEGLSPEAEPSARDIARLVGVVRRSGATTVFSETLLSPKLAQTVAREAGVETAVLDPLEGLTDDAVGAGDDYFTVMRANLAALQKALGCTS